MAGRRRGTDEAGISKLPDGRYRVRVTTRGPKGKPVEADRRVGTYEEAVSLRASLRAALETAGEVQRPKRPPTVEAYADTYLELRKVERAYRPNTVASAVYCLERVCQHLGALRLDEVRRSDLRELAVVLARDWSPRTARLTWAYATMCLRDGWAEWGLPDQSQGLKGPSGAVERAGRVLSPDEIARILDDAQAQPAPMYQLLLVALTTGLRRTELFHLERASVHLDAPQPHLIVTRSKTRAGKGRSVPLAPLVVEVLRGWLLAAPESSWLFPRQRDPSQPFLSDTFYSQLIAALRMTLAGHANLKEQAVYLRPSAQTLAAAAAPAWRVIEGGRGGDLGIGSGDGAGEGGQSTKKTTA